MHAERSTDGDDPVASSLVERMSSVCSRRFSCVRVLVQALFNVAAFILRYLRRSIFLEKWCVMMTAIALNLDRRIDLEVCDSFSWIYIRYAAFLLTSWVILESPVPQEIMCVTLNKMISRITLLGGGLFFFIEDSNVWLIISKGLKPPTSLKRSASHLDPWDHLISEIPLLIFWMFWGMSLTWRQQCDNVNRIKLWALKYLKQLSMEENSALVFVPTI